MFFILQDNNLKPLASEQEPPRSLPLKSPIFLTPHAATPLQFIGKDQHDSPVYSHDRQPHVSMKSPFDRIRDNKLSHSSSNTPIFLPSRNFRPPVSAFSIHVNYLLVI